MANAGDIWILVTIQAAIVIFILVMLGVIAFSLVRIARYLGETANELKRRRWDSDERK